MFTLLYMSGGEHAFFITHFYGRRFPMSVFRIEKNKNYTVMSNHHLRNKELSLKSKGLLSLMLSLPEEWDYTLKGLSIICKEGIDAIHVKLKQQMKPLKWDFF